MWKLLLTYEKKRVWQDQEVFEITDFTTASDWERFIASIEEIIHEWRLVNIPRRPPLKKIESSRDVWNEKSEQLTFADVKFLLTHHSLKEESVSVSPEKEVEDETEDTVVSLPQSLEDMMSMENDFPPRAHCLCRWFGLRDFLVMSPVEGGDAVTSESRANLLLSSISIAINNTNCQIPIFVQIHQKWKKLYFGQCESPGVRTVFDMVHLKRAPPQFYHLSGLLDIFKGKLLNPISHMPPTKISVRITYQLQDWIQHAWPQLPPDMDLGVGDSFTTEFGCLPFGASEEPISELHLAAIWPSLTENWVIDNDIHSDLDPMEAPQWSVRVLMNNDSQCLLGEHLKEFLKLGLHKDSTDVALIQDDDEERSEYPQALQKLTGPDANILQAVVSKAKRKFRRKSKEGIIPKDILDELLLFLFPDAVDQCEKSPVKDIHESKEMCESIEDLLRSDCTFVEKDEDKDFHKSFKSAPENSLTYRLAIGICHINYNYNGLPAIAHLWNEFVLEMRFRWENNITIIDLETGPPNLACCLLHQKLQMLNFCIEKKCNREGRLIAQNIYHKNNSLKMESQRIGNQQKSSLVDDIPSKLARKEFNKLSALSDEDDEFFDCKEDLTLSTPSEESYFSGVSDESIYYSAKNIFSTAGQDNVSLLSGGRLHKHAKTNDEAISSSKNTSTTTLKQEHVLQLPEGRLYKHADINLLLTNTPMYIPITQEASPMTEDMLEQQAEVLIKLGTNAEGTHLRARMQSACLVSDMESFKAANPGCILEDFVRWYSPRDWNEEINSEGKVVGSLSPRMLLPGNIWQEGWENAKPLPVHRQKRLFDDTKEAEKVLHFLSVLKPSELVLLLIPILIHSSILRLQEEVASLKPTSGLKHLIEKTINKIPKVVRAPRLELSKFTDLVENISMAEEIIAQLKSLHSKFGIQHEKNPIKRSVFEHFVCNLVEEVEVAVVGAGKSECGTRIRNLFTEAQKATHMIIDDLPLASSSLNHGQSTQNAQHHLTVPEFPEPMGREFILRNVVSRPDPSSRPTPQRMFCILLKDDFRLASAFTEDTTFQ